MTTIGQASPSGLQSVDSYLAEVLAAIRPLAPLQIGLDEADGAVLAEDIAAGWPLPDFDNSAMDGYAVVASDLSQATRARPVTLSVVGVTAAGDTAPEPVKAGTCIRIMTGALLPSGADAVVPVEWTDGGTGQVAISRAVPPGNAIRGRGSEAGCGQLLLTAGTRLGPAQLGLLATAGRAAVTARSCPRVTVISAGNEFAGPAAPLMPGRIWESNGVMLAAAARRAGCQARRLPAVRDDPAAVLAAINMAIHAARKSCQRVRVVPGLRPARD